MKLVTLKTIDRTKFIVNLNHIVYITVDTYLGVAKVRVTNGDRLVINLDEYERLKAMIEDYE